ncbi:MAG: PAS domain-containing protein, partial [Solirubrobacteraceae bacterium]|nr:PAS domain-containing protein [Solirubrobacteraceae bacterium]
MSGSGAFDGDRQELVRTMIALVARDGVAAAVGAAEEGLAGHSPALIAELFGDAEGLLEAAAHSVASTPVLLPPRPGQPVDSVRGTVEALASEHRAYVDADPVRFAAVVQFASAGIFGRRSLQGPMADRHRRTKFAARARLAPLRGGALTTADVASVAEALVDGATGIEMCHLMDRDLGLRLRAYEPLVESAVARLEEARSAGVAAEGTFEQLGTQSDYRLRLVVDPDGIVVDVLEVAGLLEWDSRLVVGRHASVIARDATGGPADDVHSAGWHERLAYARIDPSPAVYVDLRPGQAPGTSPQATCRVTPVHGEGGVLVSILVELEDHSETVRREHERREVEHQLRNAVELTGLGCYVAYIREPRIDTDARYDEIYGIDPQGLMEREGFDGFFGVIHTEDAPRVRRALEAAMTGEVDYIASFRLWAHRPDGPELRWIEALGRVESDEQGPLRVIGVVEDVTDRRKAQDVQLRTQKREAIGTLSAGIAHDFNNVLGAVLANAAVARGEVEAGLSPAVSVREIERGAK